MRESRLGPDSVGTGSLVYIDRLEYLLSVPSDHSVWTLRLDPSWDALRGNPRFEALVAEG